MGYSVTTIAIRGKSPEQIHSEFGVRLTGEAQEEPEAAVVGAQLPRDWYLLYINDRINPSQAVLEQLSRGAELIHTFAEEHVMVSSAAGWRDGKEIWSITHDSQVGCDHLETIGNLPEEFGAISQRFKDQQRNYEGTDFIFEIAIEVACALTGFRYDGNNEGGYPVESFDILERIKPPRRWWEFWRP